MRLILLAFLVACGVDDTDRALPHCDDVGMPAEDKSSCSQGGLCTWKTQACCKRVRWHQDTIDPKCEMTLQDAR